MSTSNLIDCLNEIAAIHIPENNHQLNDYSSSTYYNIIPKVNERVPKNIFIFLNLTEKITDER